MTRTVALTGADERSCCSCDRKQAADADDCEKWLRMTEAQGGDEQTERKENTETEHWNK